MHSLQKTNPQWNIVGLLLLWPGDREEEGWGLQYATRVGAAQLYKCVGCLRLKLDATVFAVEAHGYTHPWLFTQESPSVRSIIISIKDTAGGVPSI